MEHTYQQLLATILEPGQLEDHQDSPDMATKGLLLEGMVKELDSRHLNPICVVKSMALSPPLAPALLTEERGKLSIPNTYMEFGRGLPHTPYRLPI